MFTYRIWVRGLRNRAVGDEAGHIGPNGYRHIRIDYESHLAHRIAWLYINGEWPPDQIDHINTDKLDNRISNLRPATASLNGSNRGPDRDNRTGLKGVYYNQAAKRWMAQIRCQKKSHYLGLHDTPEEAHAAYIKAAKRLFGEFARAV